MSAKRRGQEVNMDRRSVWPGVGLAIALLLTLQSAVPASPWGRSLVSLPEAVKKVSASAVHAVLPEAELLGKPHLIGFYAEQSMEAKRMRFLGDLLEKELPGTKIVWLEAWDNPLNERLRATIDLRNQCGGVPYLFNRKTGKVLCGVVAYDKLRAWAQGLGGDARIYRDLGECLKQAATFDKTLECSEISGSPMFHQCSAAYVLLHACCGSVGAAIIGMFLVVQAKKLELRQDKEGTGVTVVGIAGMIFAQTLMVFAANPRRIPKEALIMLKTALCVFSLYVIVTTAEKKKMSWAFWFMFLLYAISAVPVCITIYSVSRHGKSTDRSRLQELSHSERAGMHGRCERAAASTKIDMDRNAAATEEEAWRRFDEAIEALRCARHADQAKAPDDELLANLESLSAPFRGSSRVLIVSSGGKTIFEFDFHVQQCSGWIQLTCTKKPPNVLLRSSTRVGTSCYRDVSGSIIAF
ncbi:unnamed protein product [Symbiodinium sp. CCMP2456]|nr:unnamed protein product [Symbiodinium sp. CCMP2456]